jgi:Mg/Co/Ni transporter MgtE
MALSAAQSQILVEAVQSAINSTPSAYLIPFVNQPPAKAKVLAAFKWLQTPANWSDLVAQLNLAAIVEDLLSDPKKLAAEMNLDNAARMADEHEASTRTRNAAVMNQIEQTKAAEADRAKRDPHFRPSLGSGPSN